MLEYRERERALTFAVCACSWMQQATANPQSLEEYAQYADLEAVVAARAKAARAGAKL